LSILGAARGNFVFANPAVFPIKALNAEGWVTRDTLHHEGFDALLSFAINRLSNWSLFSFGLDGGWPTLQTPGPGQSGEDDRRLGLRTNFDFLAQDGIASDIEDGASEMEKSEMGDAGFVSAQGDADQILHFIPEKHSRLQR
jgi:hypothetical protein